MQVLDKGCDVERLHPVELVETVGGAPIGKAAGCIKVGFARVVVVICAVKNSRTRCAAFGVGA